MPYPAVFLSKDGTQVLIQPWGLDSNPERFMCLPAESAEQFGEALIRNSQRAKAVLALQTQQSLPLGSTTKR